MPVRLPCFYPPSENAIPGTLTATWLCKPLFSYFQSGRIWHCFLHSFPTKLAHLHIGCKCPSNDIEVVLSGQMEYLQKIFSPAGFGCYERQRSCEWLQRTPWPPRAAPPPPMDGLRPTPSSSSSRSTLRQFIDWLFFHLLSIVVWPTWNISTSGHFDTFAVTINNFSLGDQGSLKNCFHL